MHECGCRGRVRGGKTKAKYEGDAFPENKRDSSSGGVVLKFTRSTNKKKREGNIPRHELAFAPIRGE